MATKDQKARQRAQRAKSGGRQISASLKGDEVALLDRLKEKHPELNQKQLLIAGLRSLEGQNRPSNAELLAELERRLKD